MVRIRPGKIFGTFGTSMGPLWDPNGTLMGPLKILHSLRLLGGYETEMGSGAALWEAYGTRGNC